MLASLIFSALALSGSALAQNTAAVPACALTCVLSSLPGTGCASFGVSNITCICTDSAFQLAYYTCQQSSCSATDLQAALAYGAQTCQSNGTPITTSAIPSGFSGSSAPASSSAQSSMASMSSSAAGVASSASASVSSVASSASRAVSSAASGVSSAAAAATSRPASGAVKTMGGNTALAAAGLSLLAVVGGVALLF